MANLGQIVKTGLAVGAGFLGLGDRLASADDVAHRVFFGPQYNASASAKIEGKKSEVAYQKESALEASTEFAAATGDTKSYPIPISSFKDLVYDQSDSKEVSFYINFNTGDADNLLYRSDPNDLSGDSDSVVEKEGVWRMAMMENVYSPKGDFAGWVFGGGLNNDNHWSNTYPDQLAGWIAGYMYGSVFDVGQRPDDIVIMHDLAGDGPGELAPVGNGGFAWHFNPSEDIPYYSKSILFGDNELRGDVGQMPVHDGSGLGKAILPKMIISQFQDGEAIYRTDESGKSRRVDLAGHDPAGHSDAVIMASYWLTDGHGPHTGWAEGADWDVDGDVDFIDFRMMSRNWTLDNSYLNE